MQIKNSFILFLFLLLAVVSNAQRVHRKGVEPVDVSKYKKQAIKQANVFTIEQFNGKWQEISRRRQDNKEMEIIDTILLNFTEDRKANTREGNQSNIAGAAEVEQPGNILLVAADVYTILSVNENQAVLLDEQESVLHTFNKTLQFAYETLGNLFVTQDVYSKPIVVNLPAILGKWSVYRRQAKPGVINPGMKIIYQLHIIQKINDTTATGQIIFYQADKSESIPCLLTLNNAEIEVIAGSYKWSLQVYKADGKELVFGNIADILYYAKQL